MAHYAFHVNVDMIEYLLPRECWKPDCKEKGVFIFYFMNSAFPTCVEHADEFFKILKETYRIFLRMKGNDPSDYDL